MFWWKRGRLYWTRRRCPAALQFLSGGPNFIASKTGETRHEQQTTESTRHLFTLSTYRQRICSTGICSLQHKSKRYADRARMSASLDHPIEIDANFENLSFQLGTTSRSCLVAFLSHGHLVPYLPNWRNARSLAIITNKSIGEILSMSKNIESIGKNHPRRNK